MTALLVRQPTLELHHRTRKAKTRSELTRLAFASVRKHIEPQSESTLFTRAIDEHGQIVGWVVGGSRLDVVVMAVFLLDKERKLALATPMFGQQLFRTGLTQQHRPQIAPYQANQASRKKPNGCNQLCR